MKDQYIKDLKEGQPVDSYFGVSSKSAPKKYKNKDGFWFSLDVFDRTGTMTAKFWGGPDEGKTRELFASFRTDDVISIKNGSIKFDEYDKKLVIHLNDGFCEVAKTEDFDHAEIVASAGKDIAVMVSSFKGEIAAITNPDIKRLLESVFDDELMARYSKSPAAKRHHHNYVGGLLEHVLSMIAISRTIAKQYEPDLDLDLMIAGCMLHDIGKIYEYKANIAIDYTVEGNLLGHIAIGTKMVGEKIDRMEGFPPELGNKILHMILSHHGRLEYGSPVTPQFPEALALHKIDDCDAQTKNSIQVKKHLLETTNEDMARAGGQFGFMYLK